LSFGNLRETGRWGILFARVRDLISILHSPVSRYDG